MCTPRAFIMGYRRGVEPMKYDVQYNPHRPLRSFSGNKFAANSRSNIPIMSHRSEWKLTICTRHSEVGYSRDFYIHCATATTYLCVRTVLRSRTNTLNLTLIPRDPGLRAIAVQSRGRPPRIVLEKRVVNLCPDVSYLRKLWQLTLPTIYSSMPG